MVEQTFDSTQSSNRLVSDDISIKFTWAIWSRYIIIALGVVLAFLGLVTENYTTGSLGLILFVLTYNVIAHLLEGYKKQGQLWQLMALAFTFTILDIISISALIFITGWLESPFWILYLVLIVFSGFGMFSYYSLTVFVIAFLSAAFYASLLYIAYLRNFALYGSAFKVSPHEMLYLINNKAVFTLVSLFLFAITGYYFSKLLFKNLSELTQKNIELLEATEEMKEVARMKDEFVTTASHELRTPLSIIRENMSLIKDGIIGEVNTKQKDLLVTSLANVDRLANILNNILDLSKIESHSLELSPKQINLCEVAAKAVTLLNEKAEQKSISVTQQCGNQAIAWVDPDQILQVFINLIDNAIKYTDKGGVIEIKCEGTPRDVRGMVIDNGKGVDKKNFSRIFERFTRIEEEEETPVKGSGLGLSICKGIMDLYHGKIWVESELGVGSKFIFSLPKIGEQK